MQAVTESSRYQSRNQENNSGCCGRSQRVDVRLLNLA